MKNKVTNTEKEAKDIKHLGHMLRVCEPGGIEWQEQQGQNELVQSDVLPTRMSPETKTILEKWGIVFGKPVEDDEIFTEVKLPEGWHKKATDHSMWSRLCDNKGRERASIFYKAAFYDRRTDLYLKCRIEMSSVYIESQQRSYSVVKKDGEIIFEGSQDYNQSQKDCEEWLKANYPDYRNPEAYWKD